MSSHQGVSSFSLFFLRSLAIFSVVCGLLYAALSAHADDTEIFFTGPPLGVKPNLLLVLDNSNSMYWANNSNTLALPGAATRVDTLKNTLDKILQSAGNLNVGMMVLNGHANYQDGIMVYPVTMLDDLVPNATPRVAIARSAPGDNAWQNITDATGAVLAGTLLARSATNTDFLPGTARSFSIPVLNDEAFFQSTITGVSWACRMDEPNNAHDLAGDACGNDDRARLDLIAMGTTNAGNSNPIVGPALLYFRNLNIPKDAALAVEGDLQVFLELAAVTNSSAASLSIEVQDALAAPGLNDLSQVGPRTFVTQTPAPLVAFVVNQTIRIDITSVIQQVISNNRASGVQLANALIRLNNNRGVVTQFCMRANTMECLGRHAPRLVYSYVENNLSRNGKTHGFAVRFQDVSVPQGAAIVSARLDLVAQSGNPGNLTIRPELADNSVPFVAGENLFARVRGTSAAWPLSVNWRSVNPPRTEFGADIKGLISQVTSRPGWCGNNALTLFVEPAAGANVSASAYNIADYPGLEPKLYITYTGGMSGCINPIIDIPVRQAVDDGSEAVDGSVLLSTTTMPLTAKKIAARFAAVPLNKNATVIDAQILLSPKTSGTGTANVWLELENSANSLPLNIANNDLSARTTLAASSCALSSWDAQKPIVCGNASLASALQTLVSQSDWVSGNAITALLVPSTGSALAVRTYEDNPGESMRLRLKVAHGGISSAGTQYTVRQHLINHAQSIPIHLGTPIVPVLNAANDYLRGTGSPINQACQPTILALMTDGAASENIGTTTPITSKAGSCTVPIAGIADTAVTNFNERCGRKLIDWMAQVDQVSTLGHNVVTTHTIGFALDAALPSTQAPDFLRDLAQNGLGFSYKAENATELTDSFAAILAGAQETSISFVSPSVPVNSFSRQDSSDEIYYALFQPTARHRWAGNIKRYRLRLKDITGALDPQILDANGRVALDATESFLSTSKSFWSLSVDGADPLLGGAAERLPASASRNLWVFTAANPAGVAAALSSLAVSNTAITAGMLGATDAVERARLITYIRGQDPITGLERKLFGDPLHSAPKAVTYSCTTPNVSDNKLCDKPDKTLFFGTNEGFMHALNADTGVEQFAFMPQALFANVKKLSTNGPISTADPKPYGLDNPVALWVRDTNRDGKIFDTSASLAPQAGEFVYAYLSMGRGGRNLYALDVTQRTNPEMLWFIQGGGLGFQALGQTWSEPVRTRIKVGSVDTDVLVFGGGYDPDQDNTLVRTADDLGNALYIVNARTGALIWSAGNTASSATLKLGDMNFSMPAKPRVIDFDQDGLADQIFIGDMGGQIWRFFINNGNPAGTLVTAGGQNKNGLFAATLPSNYDSLPLTARQQKLRRFYSEPDVAIATINGRKTLSVNIGSGFRGGPLDTIAQDRFYALRTANLSNANVNEGTIRETNLVDLTSTFIPNATQQSTLSLSNGLAIGGWFIGLSNSGEKVMARAITVGKTPVVFFNTYQPITSTTSCSPEKGVSRAYAVRLLDAQPAFMAFSGTATLSDRFSVLSSAVLPASPELICSGSACFVASGSGVLTEIVMPPMGTMFWIDQ